MYKRIFIPILFVFVIILSSCTNYSKYTGCQFSDDPDTIKICTTLFPQYDFAKQVGGDLVEVSLLIKPGVEAHSYEPEPQDLISLNESDIFIYTNDLMEPWVANRLLGTIENEKLIIVNASKNITLKETKHHHHHGEQDEEHHLDPHVWTSIHNAIIMIDTIKETLSEHLPEHKETFENNANTYKEELLALDQQFKVFFDRLDDRTIIHGGHFALGYFALDYDLSIQTIFESYSPDEDVTPQDIIALVELLKETGQKAIFQEEFIDSQTARVIKDEMKYQGHEIDILILHGLHNVTIQELEEGATYLSIMNQNLQNLKKGLTNHD